LNPETDDAKAGSLALSIIREADPRDSAVLEVGATLNGDAIQNMSLSELVSAAQQLGIDWRDPSETPPAALADPS
jgi:hypothetical protein